jgi:hypothetical protein
MQRVHQIMSFARIEIVQYSHFVDFTLCRFSGKLPQRAFSMMIREKYKNSTWFSLFIATDIYHHIPLLHLMRANAVCGMIYFSAI